MQVRNDTRGTIIASDVIMADNVWTRLRGLLGRPPLREGQALAIKPSRGIHTWFMGYPIDVLYVDKDGQVVRVIEAIAPWRFAPIDLRSHVIIELPPGAIARTRTEVSDRISLS
jgi:hypothetical protein